MGVTAQAGGIIAKYLNPCQCLNTRKLIFSHAETSEVQKAYMTW